MVDEKTGTDSPRILIVEDEAIIAMRLEQLLTHLDYEVVGMASRGEDAISAVAEKQPDLILMDIQLAGELDGVETAARIRERFDTPIVYLSAHPERMITEEVQCTQPAGFLSKPVRNQELLATVEMALYKYQMETKLRESEEKHRTLLQNIQAGVVVHGADSQIITCNRKAQELLGLTENQILGAQASDPTWQFLREDGTPMRLAEYPVNQVLNTGQPLRNFILGMIRSGENDVTWSTVSADPIFDAAGDLKEVIVSFMDITDRKQAEVALQESESRLRTLFETTTEGIVLHEVVYDEAGTAVNYRILDANSAFERHASIPVADIRGKLATEAYGTDEPPYLSRYAEVAVTGKPTAFETYFPPMQRHFYITAFSPARGQFATLFQDITERKQMEDALRKSLLDLKLAQEIAEIGNWQFDPAVGVPIWSDQVYKIYERDPQMGPPHIDEYQKMYEPDQFAIFNTAIQRAIQEGEQYDITLKLKLPSGVVKWVHAICQPDNEKGPAGHFLRGTIQDVTERKQLEMQLQKSEHLLNATGKIAKVGGWELDAQTKKVSWTEETYRLHEVPFDYEPSLQEAINFFHPKDRGKLSDAIERALEKGEPYDFELRFITAKDKHLWTRTVCEPQIVDGKVVKLKGIFQDVTSRKEAEETLRASEEHLRITLNSIGDAMIATDPAGRVVSMNPVAETLTGWKVAEARQKPLTEIFRIVNAQSGEPAANPVQRVLETGRIVKLANHTKLIAKNGAEYQIADSAAPIQGADGETRGVVLVFRDVTEEYRMREALRESEKLLSRSQEISHTGSWKLDLTTNRLTWSDEVYRIFGCKPQEFAATYEAFLEFIHPDDRAAVDEAYSRSVREGSDGYEIEHRIIRRNSGEVQHVHERCVHERDAAGAIIQSTGMVQDITERKRAEEALRESSNSNYGSDLPVYAKFECHHRPETLC